jgi:hypothetical protein
MIGENPGSGGHIFLQDGATYQNGIIENNISFFPPSSSNYMVRAYQCSIAPKDNVRVRNNLSSTNIFGGCQGYTDADYCNYGDGTHYVCSNNIVSTDPKFVNSSNNNFHLQFDSPAIDKGLAFSGRTKDADGNSIVGAPDIGAYEYGSTPSGDATPPAAPSIIEVK